MKNKQSFVEKEVQKSCENLAEFLAKEAESSGKLTHPMVHAQALLMLTDELVSLPIESAIESGDEQHIETCAEILAAADAFKNSTIQVVHLTTNLKQISVLAPILGLIGAAKELLEGFEDVIEREIKGATSVKKETPVTEEDKNKAIDEILKGIASHEG